MNKYKRQALEVQAEQYQPNKGLEDGFELWTQVITNGWISHDNLVQIKKEDGTIICPFIVNKRGRIFIRHNDYIIIEKDYEKHVCAAEKFKTRFIPCNANETD